MSDARDYYVTLRRGETKPRTAFLVGPLATHAEALALVDRARDEADKLDPWTHFDAIGTASLPRAGSNPVGKLNERLAVTPRASGAA